VKKKKFIFKRYTFFATKGRFGERGEWVPISPELWQHLWADVKDRDGEKVIVIDHGDPLEDTFVDVLFDDGKIIEGIYSRHLKIV
jgi:hypothetical protein